MSARQTALTIHLPGNLAKPWARKIPRLIGFLTVLMCLLPAFADPVPVVSNGPASGVSTPNAYLTVSHFGEPDQQAALREGQLLSRRRSTDPFGNSIRGPYKALPAVVEHPVAASGPPTTVSPVINAPTLEKAVQELAVGAVNVGAHEILIGSRSIREGDLVVLESGGRQFVVWVQNVGVRGVLFCDIDMQKHILKPFGSGPKELPEDSVWGATDIRNFLKKDAHP
jgi:hypothetical protein